MSTKPTIVLAAGTNLQANIFDEFVPHLEKAGYPVKTVNMPSQGCHPGVENFLPEVGAVRSIIQPLIELEKEVVLYLNSSAGAAGTEACRGLVKAEQEKQGKKGGIIRIIYQGALIPAVGKSAAEYYYKFTPAETDPEVRLDLIKHNSDNTCEVTDPIHRFFQDLPPEEAKKWAAKVVSASINSHMSALTYDAYDHVPTAYLVTLEDHACWVSCQYMTIKEHKIPLVEGIKAGHCPWISQPEAVSTFIQRAIETTS